MTDQDGKPVQSMCGSSDLLEGPGHHIFERQFFISKSKDFPFGGRGSRDNSLMVAIDLCPGGLDFLVYEFKEGHWYLYWEAPLYVPVASHDPRWEWDQMGPFYSREEAVKNVPKAVLKSIESIRETLDDLEVIVFDDDHLADLDVEYAEMLDDDHLADLDAAKALGTVVCIKEWLRTRVESI